MTTPSAGATTALTYSFEVVTLPVTDVDRSRDFYANDLAFALDVDYHPTPGFRVVQLTPPGSSVSIQLGTGLTTADPGTAKAMYLVVSDLDSTYQELLRRGVPVSSPRHKAPPEEWQGDFEPGLDPARRDYASFVDFMDPDGNLWILQERGHRP